MTNQTGFRLLILGLFFWVLADLQDISPYHQRERAAKAYTEQRTETEVANRSHDLHSNTGTVFMVLSAVAAMVEMWRARR